MIVVDASVAVKWLWPEAGHVEAKQLLQNGTPLAAPAIIRIEVAGAVLRRFRANAITESEAQTVLAKWDKVWRSGILQIVPIEDIYELAIAVSTLTRHAFIDCLYVAAGKELNAPLLTADKVLHKRCDGPFGTVRLLSAANPH